MGNWLIIKDDYSYNFNYYGGNLDLDGDLLVPGDDERKPGLLRTYRVKEVTANKPVPEIALTEREFCCDYLEFARNEQSLFTETHERRA